MLATLWVSPLFAASTQSVTNGSVADSNNLLLFVFKWTLILVGFLYVLFAFIVVRQIMVMNDTLDTPLGKLLLVFGYVHLFLSILYLLALFLLL